ncbi:sensor histidine kinase [Rubrolithibacter danxiaensis]|uniref:sensor histidine kinase n=1 Tax=Rubrolithibacter danxiaensis TaxID=3390805 RepID=UPI003BF7B000
MAASFLSSTRVKWIFAGVWLIWFVLHLVTLAWLGLEWRTAAIDSLVSNLLLMLSALIISNTLRYYQPGKERYFYIAAWCFLLTGLWLLMSNYLLSYLLEKDVFYDTLLDKSLPVRFGIGFLMISWMALVSMLWFTQQEQKENEQRKADAEKLAREAELFRLRQQLQPHFLFNSLNSISALIGRKPEEARTMIYQLSDFLRGTLKKEENEFVTLEEELQHLQLYLEIEKVRFGHRLATEVEQEEGCKQLRLPAMLLQPLVENSIKFGLYDTIGEVIIRLKAYCIDHQLVISIENPYDPNTAKPRRGTGFGITGIKRRLYLLFGRQDLLETRGEKNIFTTTVKIPQV